MTSAWQHVAQEPYNRAEVGTRGLACPFAKSDPETYMSIDACKATEGFKEPRLLFEHIWRKHTRFFRCGFCPLRWSISTSRKEVKEKKEDHWKSCDGKLRSVLYFEGPDESSIELLDWKQQELFEKIRSMRDVEAKLEALYKACRKPVPETYHATAASLTVQPQMIYAPGRITTQDDQQSISHGEGIFEGFSRPRSGASRVTRQPTTTNLSKVNAELRAGDNSAVSGANRPRDADSGYSSMPQNNGDTDDVFYDRLAAQSGAQYHVPHEVRPYEMSGDPVVTASPGRLTDDDSFPPIDCFRTFDNTDPLLSGGIGSSTRRDDSLLGLALSNPGPETSGGPLAPWDYAELDPVFLEI